LNRKHHLAVSGQTAGYDHSLSLHTTSCNSCLEAHLDRATWLELDIRFLHDVPDDPAELAVRARPPHRPAAAGDLVLELRGQQVAALGMQLCGIDQRGVITRIEVEPPYRLRRFGTVLVLAALNHRPGYRWSTADIGRSAIARAFWSAQHLPADMRLGEPCSCSHMADTLDTAPRTRAEPPASHQTRSRPS
jgi:GNAT superfamily N-acetyltransferase